jgi:hypothetical protein
LNELDLELTIDECDLSSLAISDPIFRFDKLGQGHFVQVVADVNGTAQRGGKVYISPHACHNEVIQSCLKAWLAWLEHEGREAFRFRGQPVASPHLDYRDLAWSFEAGIMCLDVREVTT